MTQENDPHPSVDGISSPILSATKNSVDSPHPSTLKRSMPIRGGKTLLIAILVAAALYSIPALFLILLFPTRDGSLSDIKSGATALYGLGTFTWLLIGMLGFLRISSLKDRPKSQLRGMLRLSLIIIPMTVLSIAVIILINREPRLELDILSPKTSSQLIAPLPVEFGTNTASTIFAQQKLVPLKYLWDFNGDGVIDQESFDSQATFTYLRQGVYSATLVVIMTNNTQKKLSKKFVISKDSFSVDPPSPLIDEAVKFSLSHLITNKDDVTNIQWDFESDGIIDTSSTSLDSSYTYRKLGSVTATATIFFKNQTQTKLSRVMEVVTPRPPPFPVTLETDPSTLVGPSPFTATFKVKASVPIVNVSWNFGDETNKEGSIVTHTYKKVGTFTATALIRSQSGTVARISKVVQVPESLIIGDLTFEGTPKVLGDTIVGEAPLLINITPVTSQPLITFSWDAPNASEVISLDRTLNVTYIKEGEYNVQLIAIDPDNKVLRKRINVSVRPASPVVSFSMDPIAPQAPATVKFDASESFIPSSEDVTGFEWDFGDKSSQTGPIFTGARIEHTFEKSGDYVITVRVKTTSGKEYSHQKTLVVRDPLKLTEIRACFLIQNKKGTIQAGSAVTVDPSCSTGSFQTWNWDFGDGSQSDARMPLPHVYTSSGQYRIVLTATTRDGRKSSSEAIISVLP